jgi:small-conductance mechanosensitive channel
MFASQTRTDFRTEYPDRVSRINPTLRGFLIIAAIAGVVVVLQLQATLAALFLLARIAFLLAIAFFVYLMWRERRSEISAWPGRARTVFYGAALLIVADIAAISFVHHSGSDSAAFVVVLAFSAFAMWRVWRDQHTYV